MKDIRKKHKIDTVICSKRNKSTETQINVKELIPDNQQDCPNNFSSFSTSY